MMTDAHMWASLRDGVEETRVKIRPAVRWAQGLAVASVCTLKKTSAEKESVAAVAGATEFRRIKSRNCAQTKELRSPSSLRR